MEENKTLINKNKEEVKENEVDAKIIKRNAFFEKFIIAYKKIFYEIKRESTTRSKHWQHKIASCYMHALEGFLKDFIYGSIVKSGVMLAFSMLSPKKKLAKGFKQIFTFDTALFGLFTGGFLATFRLILCKLRALRDKEDKYNSIIAGFLAAFVLWIDKSKSRRITVAVYSFARCFESIIKLLDSNDVIKERKMWPILLMWTLHIYISITWYYEFDWFPPGLEKALLVISGPKPNDWNVMDKITRKVLLF